MAQDPTIGRLIALVNKHSVDLTKCLRELDEAKKRLAVLERGAPREERVEVTQFPSSHQAIDPILMTESDAEFEDIQEEEG